VTIADAYSALGLDASSATPEQARTRFRDLIRANHPDGKPSHEQVQANEATRLLVEAYTSLRREGFPRVVARKRKQDASGPDYERQAAPEPEPADPLAWLDETWRENVRRSPPEVAIAKAILRAFWWAIGGAALAWLGVRVVFGPTWFFGVLWIGLGARFLWATWTMGCEVARYWRVFRRVASPSVLTIVRRRIAQRLGIVAAALVGLVAGAFFALRLFGTTGSQ